MVNARKLAGLVATGQIRWRAGKLEHALPRILENPSPSPPLLLLQTMIRICLLLIGGLALTAAEPGVKAQFMGGTLAGVSAKSSARLDLTSAEALVFRCGQTELRIPFQKINTLEYGQTVSRRYAAAVLISPVLLLSKSRKHFVTIEYLDGEGRQQALVFRVEKGDIRPVLSSLQARTGRRVDYQDDEARKGSQ
jgi:hypothetical protein